MAERAGARAQFANWGLSTDPPIVSLIPRCLEPGNNGSRLLHAAAMSFGGLIGQRVASRPTGGVGRVRKIVVTELCPSTGLPRPQIVSSGP